MQYWRGFHWILISFGFFLFDVVAPIFVTRLLLQGMISILISYLRSQIKESIMSVKLREKKNTNGTTSLYLDIYFEGKRRYEFLKHLQLTKNSSPADRKSNSEKKELAKKIALKRAQELSASDYNMTTDIGKKTTVAVWMQAYVDKYKKKDKRNMQGVLNRFKDFLIDEKKTGLSFGQINEALITDFQDYLRTRSMGEGSASYFNRFKKMMRQAKKENLITVNPASEVKTKMGKARKKDILTLEEIQLLAKTNVDSPQVKRAALFSAVTGNAWIDVKMLRWEHINLKSGYMVKPREKNEEHVDAPHLNLNSTALELLGKAGKPEQFVFDLPTANGCNKTLKAWVKRAGIEKKITWHNLRHSFGTNLVFLGTDVITASELLGHTSLKHTQRYVRAARELKERATDKLNIQL